MALRHKLVFISMILITILCISNVSVVSASTLDNDLNDNLTDNTLLEQIDSESSSQSVENIAEIDSSNEAAEINDNSLDQMENSNHHPNILTDGDEEEQPDIPDLIPDDNSDDINYVYPSNIKKYFPNGVLDSKYQNKTLMFIGNFEDLGKLTVRSPYVNITGLNANLKNIVFDIKGSNVSLSNLNLVLDKEFKENHGAGVFIAEDNVNLFNLTINYTVPDNVEAYGILVNEYIDTYADNLKIANCSIYFEGHNEDLDVYNCAVKLIGAYYSMMENNTIICSLPLKLIIYGVGVESLDSEYAYAVGLENCEDFILNNNTIITDINKRPAIQYPTLDSISISQSDNVVISNNSIYMTDFVTPQGVENFLYGINAYNLNDMLIVNNTISIITTGGKLALGTAYPIQISGPTTGINITENNISSISNGPNLGIYSQNFFGDTELFVSNNIINITGLAGQHEWSLVAGIESQDTYSEIFNNTIEVHSIAEVNDGDNIYGVSYRQSTDREHAFSIEDNTVFSDGKSAVYILGSDEANVTNNHLISFNDDAETGGDSYIEGPRAHGNTHAENNIVTRADDYYRDLSPTIEGDGDSEDDNHHTNPLIPHNGGENSGNNPMVNPVIPGYHPNNGINDGNSSNTNNSNFIDDGGSDDGDVQGSIDDNSNNGHTADTNTDGTNKKHSDNNGNERVNNNPKINSTSSNGQIASNNTDANPGLTGNNPIGKSPDSSSEGQTESVAKKAFKLEEVIDFAKDKTLEMILLIIGVLILLIIGYKRKKTFLE